MDPAINEKDPLIVDQTQRAAWVIRNTLSSSHTRDSLKCYTNGMDQVGAARVQASQPFALSMITSRDEALVHGCGVAPRCMPSPLIIRREESKPAPLRSLSLPLLLTLLRHVP